MRLSFAPIQLKCAIAIFAVCSVVSVRAAWSAPQIKCVEEAGQCVDNGCEVLDGICVDPGGKCFCFFPEKKL